MKQTFILILLSISSILLVNAQTFQVGHKQQTFIDASRSNRSIAAEIYYPANSIGDNVPMANGTFPTLVFGHGFVMTWDSYDYLWNGIVPSGYILVFPKSEGSFSPSHTDFGKDIAFLVDAMKFEGLNPTSTFYNAVSDKSAVMGHSMGGGSAFLSIQYNNSITALATLAAAVTNPSSVIAASGIQIPTLTIAGENDCIAPPIDHQTPMFNALTSICKTYITLLGASHCQFAGSSFTCSFGETTCTPSPSITADEQHNITLQLLIPWLNNYLKDDCESGILFQELMTLNAGIINEQNCALACSISGNEIINNEFILAPNPIQNNGKIITKRCLNNAEIRIVNSMGQLVKSINSFSGNELILNMESLQNGLYIFQVIEKNSSMQNQILIVE